MENDFRLNYKSVIFGEVVSGMDVLAEIERAGKI